MPLCHERIFMPVFTGLTSSSPLRHAGCSSCFVTDSVLRLPFSPIRDQRNPLKLCRLERMMEHARSYELSYRNKGFQLRDSSSLRLQELHPAAAQVKHMHARHDFGQHSHHVVTSHGPSVSATAASVEAEDDLNFHDYIHAKHDDDKDGEESRSVIASPISCHSSTNESISHLYPPLDLVPPPAQDLFRTLMEELQTMAAIQRDQSLASSTRPESTMEATDYPFNGHHSRPLPRFMMEPLDFLSANYESCLDHGLDSHSESAVASAERPYQSSFSAMDRSQSSPSAGLSSSIPTHSSLSPITSEAHAGGMDTSGSSNGYTSKKRPISDDSQMFGNSGTITPPSMSESQEQMSPPTQDLFRMLMEELQNKAAIQRDQFLASTTRSESTMAGITSADFVFDTNTSGSNHHHQHNQHTRLPRFAMEPFDFLSPDFGTMHADGTTTQSVEGVQNVFMNSSTSIQATAQPTTPPSHPSDEEHLAPPTQYLFRTLMEELETQVAFQRDQFLAETTGMAPRVDPEEYVFNGQHLRPLPRFMFEPLDFLSPVYESCLDGGMQQGNGCGCASHHFDPTQQSLIHMDMTNPLASMGSSGMAAHQDKSTSRLSRRASHPSKYKSILPQRPKFLNLVPSHGSRTEGSAQLVNPPKKRRLGDEHETASTGSSSSVSLSVHVSPPLEAVAGESLESPISPTVMSALSISSSSDRAGTANAAEAASPEGSTEGASAAAKRPWTPKEEAQLLKLFAKRMPIKEIAQTLDRTVHSVRSRRQILTDPGFVKGKGHGVSRRCKADPATTTKLPTYAQMAFLSLAWLPDLEGTLNDVATMVEKLFSRHLNRIPRTGHKNLQIWRAQISDALAHEKGQPRPRFESFGVKRGRQWVYRLTEFGKGIVEAMGGVDVICQELLKSNEMELAASVNEDLTGQMGTVNRDADGLQGGGSGGDAGIGQGQGYGYSYRPPDARQKSGKRTRTSRKAASRRKQVEGSSGQAASPGEGSASAIANAMEAMAAGLAKMMAFEEEKTVGSSAQ
ncbi:hypothetical protein EDD21DRAFT_380000 [Dissophora ornata]|nr:hypothetical protein EDD21DRAFT_380000 [Dissophora ornata]